MRNNLPPLVEVHFGNNHWIICGIRRLRALNDFAAIAGNSIHVNRIVYDFVTDGKADVPAEIFGKFLDVCSTGEKVPGYGKEGAGVWCLGMEHMSMVI